MRNHPSLTPRIRLWLYDDTTATKRLKVATVTMQCDLEPRENLAKITHNIENIMQKHSDVNLILFGEMILGHYNPGGMPAYHREIAESIPGKTTQALAKQAKQHKIYICFGMSEDHDGQLHNTQALINPQGEIQTCHRKWNLKPGEAHAGYQPGNLPVTFTDIQGIKTGLIICSDAAHPRTMQTLLRNKPELILFSLADDEDVGWFVAKAHARLYNAWIVSANRFGHEQNYWNGHTVISDPLGVLQVTSIDREGYLIYDIGFVKNKSMLKNVIRNLSVKAPLLVHVFTHLKILKSYFN